MKLIIYGCIVSIIILMSMLLHAKDRTVSACTASWYGDECRGGIMANGQPFDPDKMTCASWYYDLGTRLLVTAGDKAVEVTVTDRGPAKKLLKTRQLDLSKAAFTRLADPVAGLVHVKVSVAQ